MMRKYALVVLDNKDNIIDRCNLDIVSNSSGNGFQLDMSIISSNLEDIITQVVQKKSIIKFTVEQIKNPYDKANVLSQWIQKYSTPEYTMALEYDDGSIIRYCDGKVTSLSKTENTYRDILKQDLTFTQVTPFYVKRGNTIVIQPSATGKKYPYRYPYSYGSNEVLNNDIDNPYILDIPLIVTIKGAITNPIINLTDSNDVVYNTVKFDDLIIHSNQELVINSAQRKIVLNTYEDETMSVLVSSEDFSNMTSPSNDTFLRANSGNSKLTYNYATLGDGFKITGTWRQYTL